VLFKFPALDLCTLSRLSCLPPAGNCIWSLGSLRQDLVIAIIIFRAYRLAPPENPKPIQLESASQESGYLKTSLHWGGDLS